ncbi:Na+/H+ antiporter subunit E [Saccharopolyspora spinosa]|uniref:Multisubunit sodium/proton antiporter MrpE subunit n=1 Tax=Saccharopolyspora spinosa TaxID=60894 RepID=A0A2N3XPN1_SACSN|nr:Na+/H+ antiporter subunit E [Saccharopolyspora spinosa]PKW12648.1 multisubunit sodium/proton antiporter MrpE subunit [Saccharopolyspora spinosa]
MSEQAIGRRRRLVQRLPLVAWLTLVWVMLWGTFDLGTLFFGLVVALLVSTVFPLPTINTNIKVRLLRLVQLVGYLAWDLVSSTARVAWQALRHGPNAKSGIVAVTLRTDSDHITAMVANAVSLAPGKFVLQIDRVNRICYVYALGMRVEDVESVRRDVLALERRVVQAVGSANEVALVSGRKG